MNIFLCFYRYNWTVGGSFICEAHLCDDRFDIWYKVLCGAGNGTACVHLMFPRAYRLHSLVNGCKWCNNKSPVRHCSRQYIMWSHKCRFLKRSNLLFVSLFRMWNTLLTFSPSVFPDTALHRVKAARTKRDEELRSPGNPMPPIPRLYACSGSVAQNSFLGGRGETDI